MHLQWNLFYSDKMLQFLFEILPFENSLCVLTMKGTDLRRLFEAIASLHGEGVSGILNALLQSAQTVLLNTHIKTQPPGRIQQDPCTQILPLPDLCCSV